MSFYSRFIEIEIEDNAKLTPNVNDIQYFEPDDDGNCSLYATWKDFPY